MTGIQLGFAARWAPEDVAYEHDRTEVPFQCSAQAHDVNTSVVADVRSSARHELLSHVPVAGHLSAHGLL